MFALRTALGRFRVKINSGKSYRDRSNVDPRKVSVLQICDYTSKHEEQFPPLSQNLNSKTITKDSSADYQSRQRSTVQEFVAAENVCPFSDHETETAKPYSEVPGPRPLPFIGNTWRLIPYIGQYQISDLAKVSEIFYKEYGKIVKLSGLVGRPDLLFIYDADEIEKAYRREGPTPFRPSMPCLVEYKSKVRKDFFGDLPGVVGVHGEQWRVFRTKVQRPVLQIQTVRKYIQPIEDVTNDFIMKMIDMKDDKDEMPADFDNEIHKWSLECMASDLEPLIRHISGPKSGPIEHTYLMATPSSFRAFCGIFYDLYNHGIGRVALDVRLGCLDPNLPTDSEPQKIINAAKYALRNVATLELKAPFWRYIPTPLWTKYVNNMNFFVEICSKYIDTAIENLKKKQITSDHDLSLLERVLKSENDPKIACVMALDLILVGIDTISMAVCSILYQLATRPVEQEKLYNELVNVLPNPDTSITTSHLDNLVYLKAFVKEVFRVYSTVIGNGRTLQEDMIICGYKIPKGIQLVFPTIVTGNMDDYVTDSKTFRPERWMRGAEGEIHPFASLPYGHGARMCLGRRFADLEIQILLAKLIRSYRLEYHHQPLDYAVTFMYAPDGELKFKMIKR